MKRLIAISILSAGLAAGPTLADHEHGNLLNRENVGGAIGAAIGGFAGSKIVKGKGRPAAAAAGAVGGWLLGGNIARNYGGGAYASPAPAATYQPTTSYQPATTYSRSRSYEPRGCCGHDRVRDFGVHPIQATYVAKCRSNVRAGPGTGYSVIEQLYHHEQVHVIGKVRGRNWYKVRIGHRQGYVYAPLLRPGHYAYGGYQ
ncbi:MAG: SH3 domain-containing protein [Gammaproteobacteria bacterium]|nr:SH3 domain-containing protein [Gammaproteobacteria bacterium]